jgi:TolA-binding protein
MPVEGAAVFESLIHDHPDAAISDDALLRLGIAYRRADQPKQALEALRLAVDQAQVPDLAAQARLLRGQILAEDFRDTASARKEYEELLVAFPETLAADRARDLLAVLTRTLP